VSLEPPPPCLECGTCCFSNDETYVRVTGDDHQRLGAAAEDLVHFVGNRAYMRMTDGHCAALRIEPSGRFVCTVYETRPDTCRDLARESPQCAGERFTKAGRAEARLVQLRKPAGDDPAL
jgi:Fe-S-cluster containining protein